MNSDCQIKKEEETKKTKQQITYKSFIKMVLMVVNICLGSFYFGYSITYFGTFDFAILAKIYNIQMEEDVAQGLLQGCIPVGAGVGALLSYGLLKFLSRRNSLLAVNVLALIATSLILIPNAGSLFFSRILQGLCVGFYSSLAPLIVNEFSPIQLSGILGTFTQIFLGMGVYIAALLSFIMLEMYDTEECFRYVFGFPLITIIIQTVLLLAVYKYQTPRYLLEQENEEKCIEVLSYIYKQRYIQEVMRQIKERILHNKANAEDKSNLKMTKMQVVLAIHLAIMQQFTGIRAVVGYASSIIGEILPDYSTVIPVILGFQLVLASLVTIPLLTKFGRKKILQIGLGIMTVCLLVISIGFFLKSTQGESVTILIVISLIVYMFDFGFSLAPVVWLYIPEIVQPKIVPFSTLANWGSAALVVILFPILESAFGSPAPLFLFLTIWQASSFVINWKLMKETKGKTKSEIYAEFHQ